MAKILRLPNKKKDSQTFLNDLIELFEKETIDKVAIVIKPKNTTENNYIMTGYFNCDVCDKQEMLSHMQVDINMDVIKANIGDLVEFI